MRNISDRLQKSEQRESNIPTSSLSEVLARILVQSATVADCVEGQVPLSGMLSKPSGDSDLTFLSGRMLRESSSQSIDQIFGALSKRLPTLAVIDLNGNCLIPQNRERIYLVGRVADRCTGDVFPFPAPGGGNPPCRKDTVYPRACGTITRNYYKQPNLGNYLINLKPGETFNGQPTKDQKARIRMLTEVECERLQGFPDDFTRYGIFNEEVGTISRANRYAMLGNAVSVPVVRTIAERIRRNTVLND